MRRTLVNYFAANGNLQRMTWETTSSSESPSYHASLIFDGTEVAIGHGETKAEAMEHAARLALDVLRGTGRSSPYRNPASYSKKDTTKQEIVDLTGQITKGEIFSCAIGGSSDIYTGVWKRDSAAIKVAVKVLRSHAYDEPSKVKLEERLFRELRVWQTFEHKNLVPLYGVTSDFGPTTSMVCPWFDNGNLPQFLQRHVSTITVFDRFRLLCDVAAGLSYMHALHVVHGDLKGSNVLVDGQQNACLCDFGLSRMMVEFDGTFALSSALGATLRWAAPEVHRLHRPQDAVPVITLASDIYSLGGVILEVLSGNIPYCDLKREGELLLELHNGGKPRRPSEPHINDDNWSLIVRCWSDVPEGRPTMDTVSNSLQQFRDEARLTN